MPISLAISMAALQQYAFNLGVRGYHSFWNAVVGEQLPCQQEPTNTGPLRSRCLVVWKSSWPLTEEDISDL